MSEPETMPARYTWHRRTDALPTEMQFAVLDGVTTIAWADHHDTAFRIAKALNMLDDAEAFAVATGEKLAALHAQAERLGVTPTDAALLRAEVAQIANEEATRHIEQAMGTPAAPTMIDKDLRVTTMEFPPDMQPAQRIPELEDKRFTTGADGHITGIVVGHDPASSDEGAIVLYRKTPEGGFEQVFGATYTPGDLDRANNTIKIAEAALITLAGDIAKGFDNCGPMRSDVGPLQIVDRIHRIARELR